MKRKIIITAALLCVTLCVPLTVFSQSSDFEMNGTVLERAQTYLSPPELSKQTVLQFYKCRRALNANNIFLIGEKLK